MHTEFKSNACYTPCAYILVSAINHHVRGASMRTAMMLGDCFLKPRNSKITDHFYLTYCCRQLYV